MGEAEKFNNFFFKIFFFSDKYAECDWIFEDNFVFCDIPGLPVQRLTILLGPSF